VSVYTIAAMESRTVSFRAPDWMIAKLEKLAESDRRSLGAVIRFMLEKQLAKVELR